MNPIRLVGVLLIVGGAFALAYGRLAYTKKSNEVTIGSINVSINEKRTVDLPVWSGIAAIVLGGVLLLTGKPK